MYYRVSKLALPDVFDDSYRFEWGRGAVVRPGTDVSIFSTGMMSHIGLRAAELLAAEGIDAEVVHLGSIKPIDRTLIAESAARTGCAVSAENHSVFGGLGSAVAEVLAESQPVWLRRVGFPDTWMHSGSIRQVMEKYGLLPADIANAARAAIAAREAGRQPTGGDLGTGDGARPADARPPRSERPSAPAVALYRLGRPAIAASSWLTGASARAASAYSRYSRS